MVDSSVRAASTRSVYAAQHCHAVRLYPTANNHLWGMKMLSDAPFDTQTTAQAGIVPAWFAPLRGEYRAFFQGRLQAQQPAIAQLVRDGLPQLIPIVLTTGQNVTRLRSEMGRATWRRFHHASETENFLRCLIWLKYRTEAGWREIAQIPRVHLRSCRNAIDWRTARFAAHFAAVGTFSQVAMLYRDTLKMGATPRPTWSLQRLKREHAKLAVQIAIQTACDIPWAAPFEYVANRHTFRRLVSDRDFVTEGKNQRHCVAAYLEDARSGACVVMACTGDTRATFRFATVPENAQDWELSGFANVPVSTACAKAAQAAKKAFNRTI